MLSMQFNTLNNAAATAKSLQSCLTLCDPMDCSMPGFPGVCSNSCPLS